MKRIDATHAPTPLRGDRSAATDQLLDGHIALAEGPDLLVQRARPIVADLVGEGRIGVGMLVAPADPIVIADRSVYRFDAAMSASPVCLIGRVRSATVVECGGASRFPVDDRVRLIDVARLPAHLFATPPPIVAVQLSGAFGGVRAPNGIFGRTQGIAVGFVTQASRKPGLASELPHVGPNVRRARPRHLDRERRTHDLGAPGRVPGADG